MADAYCATAIWRLPSEATSAPLLQNSVRWRDILSWPLTHKLQWPLFCSVITVLTCFALWAKMCASAACYFGGCCEELTSKIL